MDLLNNYLMGCSPYIIQLNYNLEKRELLVVCAKTVENWVPFKGILFKDVISFSETYDEDDILDDDLIDSVIGLHEVSDGVYCLGTEKREIIVKVGTPPSKYQADLASGTHNND